MSSKHFIELIEKCKTIHEKKSHDYARDDNPFSNFERAGEIAAVSPNVVFQVMIGIKIARLEELLRGKEPKNESIEDSFIDLANYCLLWGSYYLLQKTKKDIKEFNEAIEKHYGKDHLSHQHNFSAVDNLSRELVCMCGTRISEAAILSRSSSGGDYISSVTEFARKELELEKVEPKNKDGNDQSRFTIPDHLKMGARSTDTQGITPKDNPPPTPTSPFICSWCKKMFNDRKPILNKSLSGFFCTLDCHGKFSNSSDF